MKRITYDYNNVSNRDFAMPVVETTEDEPTVVAPDGGEWQAVKATPGSNWNIVDSLGRHIAVVDLCPRFAGREQEFAAQIVADYNSVRVLTEALAALVAADNCNYDCDTMRSEGMFDRARAALALAEGEDGPKC